MCTSYSRGALLRRQCDPVDVVRGFNSKSQRNLSAASVLRTDEKTVGGRDRFLIWLKDIFNKSKEDISHKTDTVIDRAATATTFNRPEIAASMPSDFSDKVDVINQKLANFCAVQSMKFKYGNIRAEERDAENGERAYAMQQSAIYAASRSSRFAAERTAERETDSDKMYRSERNGGVIEFAARDDPDVVSHHRCYTSPRHCYRPPPQRTKQPMLRSCVPYGYIGVPTRAIVGFAPRDTKPPIKEPNAPEKREKKDEKKDREEKKKPVIRTDGESVDSSENRAKMMADDNPTSDPDAAAFRYEWGVKLAEEQLAAGAANDNDNFAEKGRQYVTKRLWGVNLKQPKPDTAPLATASSGRGAEKPQNASSIFESSDTTTDGAESAAGTASNDSAGKSDAPSLKGTTSEYLSTPLHQIGSSDDTPLTAAQQDSDDSSSYLSSEELRKIMRTSPNMLKETIVVDDEFNIPEGAGLDTEITAWRNLMLRSAPEVKENYLSADNMENLEMVSIRPEAPQPKLDVRVVRSIKDAKDKENEQSNCGYTSPKSTEIKRVGSSRKPDGYPICKKLHTLSTQIHYVHRHRNIIQRYNEFLSSDCASINRTKMKCPGFVSVFSTKPKDSMIKKVIDEASNQRSKQQMDSKCQNKENSNDPNSNNILNSNRSPSLVKSRALSSNDQEQADAEFTKALDIVADKEIEISMRMNQLQSIDRKKSAHLSDSVASSEFIQKDKSHNKNEDVQDKVKHYEESYYVNLHDEDATHVDSIDSGSIKSDAFQSTKEDSRHKDGNSATFDSNVNEKGDDSSKDYIIDGDYVRLPGDPYPYSRENLDKWRVPHSRNLVYKQKQETSSSFDSATIARSTPRYTNDAVYINAAGVPCDSHVGNAVMETSGSGGDGSARKKMGQTNVSSRDQRVVSDCLRGDAADALGLRQWSEAFSRFDVGEKINEAARSGDNAPLRARYE